MSQSGANANPGAKGDREGVVRDSIEVLLEECEGYKNNSLYLQRANEDLNNAVTTLQNELAQMHNHIKSLEAQYHNNLSTSSSENAVLKDQIRKLEATISNNNNGPRKLARVSGDQIQGNSGAIQRSSDGVKDRNNSSDVMDTMVNNGGSNCAKHSVIVNSCSNRNSNLPALNGCADINIPQDGTSAASGFNSQNINKKKIIQAVNADLSSINKNLKINNCSSYTIKQLNKKSPVKISISNANEIPIIKKALTEAKVSFHEFKWEQEKKKAFIVHGLTGILEEDLDFIRHQLIQAGLPDGVQVSIFETGYMRANPAVQHNTLLKLVLPPNCDVQVIKNIKVIDRVVVRLVPMKTSNIIQCKNCQGFGHSASGCQHAHRCVKCGADHFKNDCPRTFDKSTKLRCCNCNGEHSANNLAECSYYQKYFGNYISKGTNNNGSSNSSNPSVKINQFKTLNSRHSGILKGPKQYVSNNASSSSNYDGAGFPSLQNKSARQASPAAVDSSRMANRVNYNSRLYSNVVADNVSGNSCANASCSSLNREILSKLDAIASLVLKHEQIISNFTNHD